MANYAFPHFAGTKARGGNFVPRPADLNGDNTIAWYQMWYDYGTGDTTVMTQWWVPMMNAAVAQGANVVRIFTSPLLRYGTTFSHLTAPQLVTALTDFHSALAARGLWSYFCVMASQDIQDLHDNFGVTTQNFTDFVSEVVPTLSGFTNTLGADVCQEINGADAYVLANVATWVTAAKAARTRTTFRITVSYICTSSGDFAAASTAILSAGGEIIDCHIYYQAGATALDTILAAATPVWVGEMGIQDNGDFVGAVTPSTPADLYDRMVSFSNLANLQGVLAWSLIDLGGSVNQLWGLYAVTQNGSFVFTTVKSAKTTRFQTIPLVVTDAAPTVTAFYASLAVRWTDFAPGASYTPQYVAADANGFPTTAWTSGHATTGLSMTLGPLSPNTRYLTRVLASV